MPSFTSTFIMSFTSYEVNDKPAETIERLEKLNEAHWHHGRAALDALEKLDPEASERIALAWAQDMPKDRSFRITM